MESKCGASGVGARLPSAPLGERIVIDRNTLEVRVYAESMEDLKDTACQFCSNNEHCDKTAIKPCLVPCG